ncbi:transposase, partial [bacterium]|nr:transposase [bacterium]
MLVVQDRQLLFGDILNGEMILNNSGKIVQKTFNEIPEYYPGVYSDSCVVMPNHFHCILIINTESTVRTLTRSNHPG